MGMTFAFYAQTAPFDALDIIYPQLDQISHCVELYLSQETQAVSINGQSILKSNIINAQNGSNTSGFMECTNFIESASNDSKGNITVLTRPIGTSILPTLASHTFKFMPTINNTSTPLSSQLTATNITGWQCLYYASSQVNLKALKVAGVQSNILSKFPYLLIC